MSYYVYVLKSEHHKKSYVGHTDNLARRLKEHNSGIVKSTKSFRPYNIIYIEKYNTEHDARNREKYFKYWKGRKEKKNILRSCGIV